jgi:hypothetical protein
LDLGLSGQPTKGPFVFQAKFVQGANAAGAQPLGALLSAVQAELRRIEDRIEHGLWRRPGVYVLITNAPLTGEARVKVEVALSGLDADELMIWSGDDVCRMLDTRPALREAYPQILGIRDLTALITRAFTHGHTERARAAHSRAAELARVFVPVPAYFRALRTLRKHNFVVLTGPPEMGKTTIGYMLGLAKMTDGWQFYPVEQARDFFDLRQDDEKQIFLVDDAFGSTEYRPDLAERWASHLDAVLRRTDGRHWIVFTSRSAPLRMALARLALEGRAESFPRPAEVIVETEHLTVEEKAQMLYRHAKAADLPEDLRMLLRAQAVSIVMSDHFTPERIRRYVVEGLPALRSTGSLATAVQLRARALEYVRNPTRRMRQSFGALSSEHKACLVALLEVGSSFENGDAFRAALRRHTGITDEGRLDELVLQLGEHFLRFDRPRKQIQIPHGMVGR